jgi:predicted RNA-binding Zn ribbon-like protein
VSDSNYDASGESDAGDGAPSPLRWIEELVNSRSVEFDTDEIETVDALERWLAARRLIPAGTTIQASEHARVLRGREGLRALIALNDAAFSTPMDRPGQPDAIDMVALDDLARLARETALVVDVTSRPPRLVPRTTAPVEAVFGHLFAAIMLAVANGTWDRLKVCRNPACRWVYYDRSRNRSRSWCSMATCGNRAKARGFRQRRQRWELPNAADNRPDGFRE